VVDDTEVAAGGGAVRGGDEVEAVRGVEDKGDLGNEGAAMEGDEATGGDEARGGRAGGEEGRGTGMEIGEIRAVAGGGESAESELLGGGEAEVITTSGWDGAEAVETGGVGRKNFCWTIGDAGWDAGSKGIKLELGELARDDGKLPGRLEGDASWGDDAGLLLEVAEGEGWLARDVDGVRVCGVARELGGSADFLLLMNRPDSSRGGRFFLLLIHKKGGRRGGN
jgi:hypothetical protein